MGYLPLPLAVQLGFSSIIPVAEESFLSRIKPYPGFPIPLHNEKKIGQQNLRCHNPSWDAVSNNSFRKPSGSIIALFGSPTNSDTSPSSEAGTFPTNKFCVIAIIQTQARNVLSHCTALRPNCGQSEESNRQTSYETGMGILIE